MGLLNNRNFTLLTSGQVISTFGDFLFTIALYWYVLSQTHSPQILAWTGICISSGPILGVFSGVFVDRWRRVRTMWVADVARALLCGVLFVVARQHHPSIAAVLAVVFLLPIFGTLFNPAYFALYPTIVSGTDLPAANGLGQSAKSTARFAGMAGGGALLAILGAPALFLVNGASFGLSALSILGLRVKETLPDRRQLHLWNDWKVAFRHIHSSKLLTRIIINAALKNVVLAPVEIVITAWVKNGLHGSATELGLILGSELIGTFASGFAMRWLSTRMRLPVILRVASILTGLLLFPLGFAQGPVVAITLIITSGFAAGLASSASSSMLMRETPAELRGRVSSLVSTMVRITFPIGMATFAAMTATVPFSILFAVIGFVTIIPPVVLFRSNRLDETAVPVSGESVVSS